MRLPIQVIITLAIAGAPLALHARAADDDPPPAASHAPGDHTGPSPDGSEPQDDAASASPAPGEDTSAPKSPATEQTPETSRPPAPAAVPPAPATAPSGQCTADSDCSAPSYCVSGRCLKNRYFPWQLRVHNRETRRTTTLIGPYLRVDDPRGATHSLLPLFWHLRDRSSGASTTLGFPLFIWHKRPGAQGGVIGPAYGYHDRRGWVGGLFPVLLLGHRNERSHQVVAPLFFHFHNDRTKSDTVVVGPIYGQRSPSGWNAGVAPLLFAGRRDDRRYGVVPPLLYAFKSDAHGSTHVLGPFYGSRRDDGYAYGLAPLWHFGRRGDDHVRWFLPPLYLHVDSANPKRSFTMVGPGFAASSPAGKTRGLFPLVWDVTRGPRHYQMLLPLLGRVEDETKKTDRFWFGPYLHFKDEIAKRETHAFVPLIFKHDQPDYHLLVQFPCFWRVVDGKTTRTALFPLYFGVHGPAHATDVAFPLVWRFVRGNDNTTVALTAYYHRNGERRDAGFAPLFGFGSTGPGKRYAWVLPPLLWHSADAKAGRSRTLATLFFWDRQPKGFTTGFIPLVFGWRRGPTTRFVAPLFFHRRDADKNTAVDVFGPIYWTREPHRTQAGVAPLFFFSRKDDHTWQATLFPLLHVAKRQDGMRWFTPLGGWSSSSRGLRGFVGPVYFRKAQDGWSAGLLPLFFHRTDHGKKTSTTVIPSLLVHHSAPSRSLLSVTPLFWRYRNIESVTTLLFPLFFDKHTFFEQRTTGLLPFFVRHRSEEDRSTTWIVPPLGLYWRRAPDHKDTVWFPLVWRLQRGDKRMTIVTPLFWDIRRGERVTQIFAPFYVYTKRATATRLLVLNFYYSRGRGPAAGTYGWDFFPLIGVNRPAPGDLKWRFLEGLVSYSRVDGKRTLKLLWAIEIPLKPAAAPATTFFDATPPSGRLTLD